MMVLWVVGILVVVARFVSCIVVEFALGGGGSNLVFIGGAVSG